ncbi:SMI1/KNR4 family protein [Streptomyces sp. NBC_00503]|uniref:SMI1/KNR4 family protein n=1 Tax=Streptomyces sp. NBC_00503 TaxID=2903659 RepID=UPI002E820ABB|nr:SMI1/KNR4 family protein [Streptomyces sp. NBC_00503]WUD83777.1 SMI1/KNR4 family protein [Streptomyces sp. NBC_00503]
MGDWDARAVRARLRQMASEDPGAARHGAASHRYELAAPLSEAEIRAFEAEHRCRLPAEYRSFLATVGDGPAGPAYGLMPLTTPHPGADADGAAQGEWEDDRRPGRMAAPCPLLEPRPFDEGRTFDPDEGLTLGTLVLADHGCGMYSRLVLNGPLAGQVWHLDQDFGSCVPESPDFRAWYTAWLEEAR